MEKNKRKLRNPATNGHIWRELCNVNVNIGRLEKGQKNMNKLLTNHVTHTEKRLGTLEGSLTYALPNAINKFADKYPRMAKAIVAGIGVFILIGVLGLSVDEVMQIMAFLGGL